MTTIIHPPRDVTYHRASIHQAVRLVKDQADMSLPGNRNRVAAGRWLLAALDGRDLGQSLHHLETLSRWVDAMRRDSRRPQVMDGPRSRRGMMSDRIQAFEWAIAEVER